LELSFTLAFTGGMNVEKYIRSFIVSLTNNMSYSLKWSCHKCGAKIDYKGNEADLQIAKEIIAKHTC